MDLDLSLFSNNTFFLSQSWQTLLATAPPTSSGCIKTPIFIQLVFSEFTHGPLPLCTNSILSQIIEIKQVNLTWGEKKRFVLNTLCWKTYYTHTKQLYLKSPAAKLGSASTCPTGSTRYSWGTDITASHCLLYFCLSAKDSDN